MLAAIGIGVWIALAPIAARGEPMTVFASIQPQRYFLERVGGDRVTVSVMVAPGASPATYEPRPSQMTALSRARLYFAIGAPFENAWLRRLTAANPGMTVIHTEAGIERKPMAEGHRHEGDGHGAESPGGDAGTPDPHIWLSPALVIRQAETIRDALSRADPAGAAAYAENHRRFAAEAAALDVRIREIFARVVHRRFMVFHPSWGYFARDYDLEQIPVEIAGKSPRPADLTRLIRRAREESIRAVFVAPQFSRKSAEVIAGAVRGAVIVADPLAPDWADNLMRVAEAFARAMGGAAD